MDDLVTVKDGQSTGALHRGLTILNALRRVDRPVTLQFLTDDTGLDVSTVHRSLKVLVETGFAIKLTGKTYMVGPSLLVPVGFNHPLIGLRHDAHSVLVDLAGETGLTATLVMIIGENRIALDIVLGRDRVTPHFSPDIRTPLHTTATGRILLLSMTAERRREVLGAPPFERFTPSTTTQEAELLRQIAMVDVDGFLFTRDESIVGVTGIAAPLRSARGRILGSLGLYGRTKAVDDPSLRLAGSQLARAAEFLRMTSGFLQAFAGSITS